jgi:hypothetical protein
VTWVTPLPGTAPYTERIPVAEYDLLQARAGQLQIFEAVEEKKGFKRICVPSSVEELVQVYWEQVRGKRKEYIPAL